MAGLDLVTAPTAEPITLDDAKAHCRVDAADDDELIAAEITAARSRCEAFLNQSLVATVWDYGIDGGFPAVIRLPIGPLVDPGTVSVSYVDDAGATQTLSPALYQASKGETGILRPAYGQTWPSTRQVMDAVTVRFTAGVTDPSAIPPAILQAIRLMVADFYDNRENASRMPLGEIPLSARNLMMPFVRHA